MKKYKLKIKGEDTCVSERVYTHIQSILEYQEYLQTKIHRLGQKFNPDFPYISYSTEEYLMGIEDSLETFCEPRE